MHHRQNKYNHKRKIASLPATSQDRSRLEDMAKKAVYGGNPEHKKNPGDFGLTPPAAWIPDKELCDKVNIFSKKQALQLLRKGIRRGLISTQVHGPWPKNVWSVTQEGTPLKAQLENHETGTYHGYPLSTADPFHEIVLKK